MKPAAIFTKLPWCGREDEVDKIWSATQRNLWAHSEKDGTKQMYDFVLVYGASGMGKSRLCYEASQQLVAGFNNLTYTSSPGKEAQVDKNGKQVTENFSAVHYLFTDFSSSAKISNFESVLPSVRLGLRLAAAFFLQSTVSEILQAMNQAGFLNQINTFTLSAVASLISAFIPEGKHIALMWHLDEFHHVPINELKYFLSELGTFMTTQHHHRISITPLLCGTASVQISFELIISGFRFKDIFLQKLARDQSKQIVCQVLVKYEPITSPLLDQALAQLGDWPRFLQLFCSSFERTFPLCGPDLEQLYARVLRVTLSSIYDTFGVDNWQLLLGGHIHAIHNMCLYALTRTPVHLDHQLNGLTVAEIRDRGILMLISVSDTTGSFSILFPIILETN